MTTLPHSDQGPVRSPLNSDQMLENYRGSVRFELDEVERMQGRPLAALGALFKIRYDAVTTITSVIAEGARLREQFPTYEAIDAANAMLKPVRRKMLEDAARACQPSDFRTLQQRTETIDNLLDGLEAHIGGRMLRSPGFPSWIGLREAFHSELEKLELWTLNIESPLPQRPLSEREGDILACLSDRPLVANDIADLIDSSEGSVRNIISDLRQRGFAILTTHGAGYHINPSDPKILTAISTRPR